MTLLISRLRRVLVPGVALVTLAALTSVATAQVTAEQQSAIRSNCRSDFSSKCSGVTPGGKDALACLQKNVASLSPGCKTAVSVTIPAPAPAQAKPTQATPAPVTAAPAAAPPPAVKPQQAQTPATPPKQPVAAPPKQLTATPPAPAAGAPAQPTAAQRTAIQQSCRGDFTANCSGVQPGGTEALACLKRNTAKLSPACKQAVAAIGGAPAAAVPAAAMPAAPADAAASGPTAQQLGAIKFTCRRDFTTHCGGVPPGGPEALACLQRNAAKLTPDCKTSLDDVGDALPAATASAPAAAPVAAPAARPLPPGITPAGRVIRRVIERN